MGRMTPESRLKMLTEKLDLTDDQQAKLKPILEDESNTDEDPPRRCFSEPGRIRGRR